MPLYIIYNRFAGDCYGTKDEFSGDGIKKRGLTSPAHCSFKLKQQRYLKSITSTPGYFFASNVNAELSILALGVKLVTL